MLRELTSPVVLVKRQHVSTISFCVHNRKSNNVTQKYRCLLPRTNDTLDTLTGSKWFSTLDLNTGKWSYTHKTTKNSMLCLLNSIMQKLLLNASWNIVTRPKLRDLSSVFRWRNRKWKKHWRTLEELRRCVTKTACSQVEAESKEVLPSSGKN